MTEVSRPKAVVVVSAILLGFVLLLHLYAVVVRAGREPHMDETEYLHAGWMMRNGERLYETFFEHHSPFLFVTLAALAPEGEAVPAQPYFVHARWLTGFAGFVALAGLAFALSRAAPEAPALGVALLFATGAQWLRGFAEVRAEAFALAFFWVGAALVLRARPVWSGLGLALVFTASLWNPKWPLASVAIGIVFLYRSRREVRAYAVAVGGIVAAFAALALIVPLDVWWFFNFDVNLALSRAVANTQEALDTYFAGGEAFLFVPEAFHPRIIVPAAAVVAASLVVKRSLSRAWPLLLLAGAFLELRFFLPWPAIWSHYYLMWSVASATVLAVVPVSLEVLVRRAGASEKLAIWTRMALVACGVLLAGAHVVAVRPVTGGSSTYWVSERAMREQLGPGDVVWIEPPRHPVTIRDAHYYWFSVGQMLPAAGRLRETARGRRYLPPTDGLPVCAPPPNLRFTLDPRRPELRGESECMDRLVAAGRVRKTVFADVWEVRLIKSEGTPGKVVQ